MREAQLISGRTAVDNADTVALGMAQLASIVPTAPPVPTDISGPLSLATATANACRLAPQLIEGPFYLPLRLVRRDIAADSAGLPLMLRIRVIDVLTRHAIQGAVVNIWHCDATGSYSSSSMPANKRPAVVSWLPRIAPIDVPDVPPAFAPAVPLSCAVTPAPAFDIATTAELRPTSAGGFLRGVQMSDAQGDVQFRTVFPGWYPHRAIHLHVKVHLGGYLQSGHVTHSGQFFVDEEIAAAAAELSPYRTNSTIRIKNPEDPHFTAGSAGVLLVVPRDRFDLAAGLLATITVAVDPDATPEVVPTRTHRGAFPAAAGMLG